MDLNFMRKMTVPAETKMVLLILDGLGGLPREEGGKTELETARTPNMDALAKRSALGLSQPAGPGIAVGSGPGHLAIFGYDPIEFEIGRGALEALGVDFELLPGDVAARGNFCSLDAQGKVADRRAGRLPTEAAAELAGLLRGIRVEGVEFFILPVKEHRFAFVMRGADLSDALSDTDPLKVGAAPLPVRALSPQAEHSAAVVNRFLAQAQTILTTHSPANMVMLRGFACLPIVPLYADIFKLKAASIAVNGMYRGVSRLVGMDVLPVEGIDLADQLNTLEKYWRDYDFFYMHVKKTDTCGENGDFDGKVKVIEEVDSHLPRLLALNPDVVIISGDHSSPAVLRAHSWHPVPTLLYSAVVRPDGIAEFGERACAKGSLGVLPATHVMPIALANAGRVAKYGA